MMESLLLSISKNGRIYVAAKASMKRSLVRKYVSGRHWIPVGGLNFSDNYVCMHENAPTLFSTVKGKNGVIIINNKDKENKMSIDMYESMERGLVEYEANEHYGTVEIVSAKRNYFCSGNRFNILKSIEEDRTKKIYLRSKLKEARAINQIYASDIPVVTIADGEVKDDACSLLFGARYPIITDNTILSFPLQNSIFPDSASSKILSRFGGIGMYLALTGASLTGEELLYLGLAPNFIVHSNMEEFVNDLAKNHSRNASMIETIIDQNSLPRPPIPSSIMDFNNTVNHLFNTCYEESSVLEVVQRLEREESDFARNCLQMMKKRRSLSQLQLILRTVQHSQKMSIHGCLRRDYEIDQQLLTSSLDSYANREKKAIDFSQDTVDSSVDALDLDAESTISLKKKNKYAMPMFRGECEQTEKDFITFSDHKYDWKKVYPDNAFEEDLEENGNKTISTKSRGFIHPVTKLLHPVPFEWEEDMREWKEDRIMRREKQLLNEEKKLVDSIPPTEYDRN